MTLHVGLIGTGAWSAAHLAALEQSPHVARVTLCGRQPARLAELAASSSKVVATASRIEQLCDDATIDVVDIVLPHDLHAPTSLAALSAGKHVICEKPAALSLAQFDAVCAAAAQAGRRFLVVMNQLYNPRFAALADQVAAGLVGRPFLLVENAYSHHSQWYHDPHSWRTRRARAGGGVLIDGGYHMVYKHLELLRPFATPAWVEGHVAQLNLTPAGAPRADLGEDFVQYVVGYDGDFSGGLRIGASHAWSLPAGTPRRWEGFLAGTDGLIDFSSGMDAPIYFRGGDQQRELDLPPALDNPRCDPLTLCLTDYLRALCESRPAQHGECPHHSEAPAPRNTLALIEAVYHSSHSAARVNLDP